MEMLASAASTLAMVACPVLKLTKMKTKKEKKNTMMMSEAS